MLLTSVVLALLPVASALAWRGPTAAQRRAIDAAAQHAKHVGGRIHVSHIRVSTVGPWAYARLTVYFGGEPDVAAAVLHRVHGHWRVAKGSPGSDQVQCASGMPHADLRNLALRGC